jgi:SP family general alpha glucoside:H+ symporter-like MFS transporter
MITYHTAHFQIPFALQWIWVLPIGVGIAFAPESPWWLTRKGRFADAEKSLMRLTARGSGFTEDDAKKQVALMDHTNQLEIAQHDGVQFWHCFQGTNLRRTEIACIVWLIQSTCGSPLMGNATYFLKQAGLSEEVASTLNLIMFAIGACGTIGSWWLMQFAGRRTIYFYGQIALNILMLLTGVLGTIKGGDGKNYAIGALLIIFTGLYDLTIGPVCYSLVAEIGSTRLRAKTVILARNLYNLGGLVINIVNPYMLNTTAWNLGAKSGYVWAITGVCGTIWTWFRLPEPKGRTYGELDILFEQKVPARLFSKTPVDEFAASERDAAHNATGGGAPAMAH